MATYLNFHDCGIESGKKTHTWIVQPKDGSAKVGTIKWYGAWRKYCFFTSGYAADVFEEICLRELAAFIEAKTRAHRAARNAA